MRKLPAPSIEDSDAEQVIELVPDPVVAKEFHTTLMALWRWDHDPKLRELGWEPPVKIRGRNHRVRGVIEKFKQAAIRMSIEGRGRPGAFPPTAKSRTRQSRT